MTFRCRIVELSTRRFLRHWSYFHARPARAEMAASCIATKNLIHDIQRKHQTTIKGFIQRKADV